MKSFRLLGFLLLIICTLGAQFVPDIGQMMADVSTIDLLGLSALGVVTLSQTQLLLLNIRGLRKRCIPLTMFGTDFSAIDVRLNQTAIARIRTLPTSSTYDAANGGYGNGAQSARSLLTDVTIKLDQWGTVPLKFEHLNHVTDQINDYTGTVADGGYVLGKQVVDHVLSKANFAYFSRSSTYAHADCDVDMLINVGEQMNQVTSGGERFMLVNSAVASVLASDQRLINSQWFGTAQGGETIRGWRNVFGFTGILEYADFPSGTDAGTLAITGVASTDVITTGATHGYKVGQRVLLGTLSGGSGLTATYYYVLTVPSATTLTLSATVGGALAGFTTDIASGTIKKATNLAAIAFERQAFAVAGGAPEGVTAELAAQFGIPLNTVLDSMYDSETQVAMGMAKWQTPGVADLWVAPTMIYGARAGREIEAAPGTTLDYAAHLVITA